MAIKTICFIESYFDGPDEGTMVPAHAVELSRTYLPHDPDIMKRYESLVEVTYADTLVEACAHWGVEFHPANPESNSAGGLDLTAFLPSRPRYISGVWLAAEAAEVAALSAY